MMMMLLLMMMLMMMMLMLMMPYTYQRNPYSKANSFQAQARVTKHLPEVAGCG